MKYWNTVVFWFPLLNKVTNLKPYGDPRSPSENGFMEPKYYGFRFGDWTSQSSKENMTMDA